MVLSLGSTTGWSVATVCLGQRQGVFRRRWWGLGRWSNAGCVATYLCHLGCVWEISRITYVDLWSPFIQSSLNVQTGGKGRVTGREPGAQ